MNQVPEAGFLRLQQIIGNAKRGITPIIPISKSSWWDGCRSGKYPKPIKLGARTTVWRASDILALVRGEFSPQK